MKDITELVLDACEEDLSASKPFIHNAAFSLYDSMSALELTDPKMDTCEIPLSYYQQHNEQHSKQGDDNDRTKTKSSANSSIGMTVPPRPLPKNLHSIDSGLPWTEKSLSLSHTKQISLELLSKFYSFLNGSSLAESVYTCYYLHQSILAQMTHDVLIPPSTTSSDANGANSENEKDTRNPCKLKYYSDSNDEYNEYKLSQTLLCLVCHLIVFNSKLTRKIMLHADIYEEEDFTPGAYAFFPTNTNTTTATTLLKFHDDNGDGLLTVIGNYDVTIDDIMLCFDDVQAQLDHQQLTFNHGKDSNHGHTSSSRMALQTILHCIQFLIHYHTVNYTLSTQLNKDNVIEYTSKVKSLIDHVALPNLETLITLISNDHDNNDNNIDSSKIQDDDNKTNQNNSTQKNLVLFKTFDPYLNRHLMGNSPVRNVTSYFATSTLQALHSLHEIMYELSNSTCKLLLDGQDLNTIYSILYQITFSKTTSGKYEKSNLATHTSNLNILPRSLIIINLYFNDLLFGQHMLPSIISNHMIDHYSVPLPLFQDTDYGIRFLTRLGKPIYDMIKVQVLNRNRQQVYIRDVMLKDWKFLSKEGAVVDHLFNRDCSGNTADNANNANNAGTTTTLTYISNYVVYVTSSLMEQYISVGIEVELFIGGWHLLTAYWYLDFLTSAQLNLLISIREGMKGRNINALDHVDAHDNSRGTKGRSKRKGKKGKKSQQATTSTNASNSPCGNVSTCTSNEAKGVDSMKNDSGVDILIVKMKRSMYRGIVRSIALLLQTNIISKPSYEFTTTEKIFQKRFEILGQISNPPPLKYDDFQKGTDFSSVSPKDLISSATDSFKTCRTILDEISKKVDKVGSSLGANGMNKQEMKSITKVCIANSLFLLKLSQSIHKSDVEGFKVEFDFSTHKHFCVMNTK